MFIYDFMILSMLDKMAFYYNGASDSALMLTLCALQMLVLLLLLMYNYLLIHG